MQLIDDVKKALGIVEDQELAGRLGKDKSTISKWRKQGEIPAKAERELRKILEGTGAGKVGGASEPEFVGVGHHEGKSYPLTAEGLTKDDLELLSLLKEDPEKYLAAKDLIKLNNVEVFNLRVDINQRLKEKEK